MKFTDKTAEKIFKSIKCYEVKESIADYPEDERDGKSDLDIIREEVEYFIYMFEEVDGPFKESLASAREILRRTKNGKVEPIYLPSFKPVYQPDEIEQAKRCIRDYRQLKRILTKI